MKLYKNIIRVLICCCCLTMASGQSLQDIRFDYLDEKDGLSNNFISDLAIDSSGFLWIGTQDGLNRYDGHTFKTFYTNPKDEHSLLHNYSQKLYVQKNGTLWISYAEGGFSSFDPYKQNFKHYLLQEKYLIKKNDVRHDIVHIQDEHKIWWTSTSSGLNCYDLIQNTNIRIDLPEQAPDEYFNKIGEVKNTITTFFVRNEQEFWIGTASGIFIFDVPRRQFNYKALGKYINKFPNHCYITKILPDGDSALWIATWNNGILHYTFNDNQVIHYNFESHQIGHYNIITDIEYKSPGQLWIVSGDKGFGYFDRQNGKFTFYKEMKIDQANVYSFLSNLIITKNNEFFLVDETSLIRYSPYSNLFQFKYLPISSSQHGNLFSIRKIFENPSRKEIYYITDLGNGFNIYDEVTGKLEMVPMEVNHQVDDKMRVFNMVEDKWGKLWVISRDYIFEYFPEQKKLKKISPLLMEDKDAAQNIQFKNFIQSENLDILIQTTDNQYYLFDSYQKKMGKKIVTYYRNKTIDHYDYFTIDKQNNKWFCLKNTLGYIPYGDSNAQYISDPIVDTFLDGNHKGLLVGYDQTVFVANNKKGLLRLYLKGTRIVKKMIYNQDNHLPFHRMMNMTMDNNGNIWMVTIKGAIYFDVSTGTSKLFNQDVGLDKFTLGMRFMKSKAGFTYATGTGKYAKVDMSILNAPMPEPKVYIDQIKIQNKEVVLPQQNDVLVLKPHEQVFSIDFGCISFINQSHYNFAYRLEGWDQNWIYCGNRRFVSYTNLNPGQYTFKVKVANNEGVWSKSIQLPIEIKAHFYKTTWFTLLMIFLCAAIIYLFYLWRIKQIQQTEAIKTAFNKQLAESRMAALRAQMNPHFIFNCLNSINRYIIKNDIKNASMYLTKFAKLMRLILDNSSNKNVLLANELDALKLYIEMESLRFDFQFKFDINIDDSVEVDHVEIPPLLIQPYVENAIWHGLLHKEGAGHLQINLQQSETFLEIEIIDNGVGREKSKALKKSSTSTRNSLGMKLTEERIQYAAEEKALELRPEIIDLYHEDGSAAGTKVIIKIPI